MPSLVTARADNADFAPHYVPVALFVGGTSGIGRAAAEAFARYTHGNAHIILCGRNRAAAEAVIASFPEPTAPDAAHEFVHCDVASMKSVHAATETLRTRLTRLNFLVLTPGVFAMGGRVKTPEGLDYKLALHYYGRWKFIHDLIPLLRQAKGLWEDAKVLTVYGAGRGGPIDLDDLGLKTRRYSLSSASSAASTYNDLMVESFADAHPDIAFTHAYPGVVRTSFVKAPHWVLSPLFAVASMLKYPISLSPKSCAEFTIWSLTHGDRGAYRRNESAEDIGKARYFGSDDAKKRLWQHTVQEIDRALES